MGWLANDPERIKIGLVGDDPTMLYLIADVLMGDGFDVVGVYKPDQVRRLAGRDQVDVVLWDETGKHEKSDGVAQILRRLGLCPVVPVLLLTDADGPNYVGRCLDQGLEDVLVKPFRVPELCARVRKAVRHGRRARLSRPGAIELEGRLEQMALPDLLFHLHQSRASGLLEVGEGVRTYVLVLRGGEIQEVVGPGHLKGRKALFRALAGAEGGFRFVAGALDGEADPDLVGLPQLVLTGVQEADEYVMALRDLPHGPLLVSLDQVEELEKVPAILEPLLTDATTGSVTALIEASEMTDLEAARALKKLFDAEILFAAQEELEAVS